MQKKSFLPPLPYPYPQNIIIFLFHVKQHVDSIQLACP